MKTDTFIKTISISTYMYLKVKYILKGTNVILKVLIFV